MMGVAYLRGNDVDSIKVNQKYITQTYTREAVRFIDQNRDKPFFLYITRFSTWRVARQRRCGRERHYVRRGQRVPTVACWPGKIKPGTVYDDLASHLDLYPTIIGLTGSQKSQTKKPLDGEDISPVLFGTGKRKGNEFAYYSNGIIEAYRKGDWKIRLPQKEVKQGNAVIVAAEDTLLFNLKTDLGEQNNLLKSNPAKARELLASLEVYKRQIGNTPPPLVQRMPSDDSHIRKRAERAAGKNAGK